MMTFPGLQPQLLIIVILCAGTTIMYPLLNSFIDRSGTSYMARKR